jgi:hypothetical protein
MCLINKSQSKKNSCTKFNEEYWILNIFLFTLAGICPSYDHVIFNSLQNYLPCNNNHRSIIKQIKAMVIQYLVIQGLKGHTHEKSLLDYHLSIIL